MTAVIIICAILLVIFLIAIIRVRLYCEYNVDGLILELKFLFFTIRLAPGKGNALQILYNGVKTVGDRLEIPQKRGGRVEILLKLLWEVLKAARDLKNKLTINYLTVHYTVVGEDAADTAVRYGLSSGIAGLVYAVIESHFKILKRDIQTNVSFTDKESSIYVETVLSLRLYMLLHIVIKLIKSFFKVIADWENERRKYQSSEQPYLRKEA